MRFENVVTDPSELRELIGEPSPRAVAKVQDRLDGHCRTFIERSPFLLIASADADGRMDVSPKGDPPGFVRVLDDRTLAIPDRPGNRRADTFVNVLGNPNVALIFLVPGKTETVRVNGTARIVRDEALRASMAIRGKTPDFALVVDAAEVFFHCSKCVIRSKLWTEEKWPNLDGLPTLAQALADLPGETAAEADIDAAIRQAEAENLY